MALSRNIVRRKKRGRPSTGKALSVFNFRAPKALMAAVRKWATTQPDKPDQSKAVRQLIERGLGK